MSDIKNSVLPEIIEPISNAIQQNIPETAKQTDGALSTVVGFFNNVVLYPVKKANLTFKYKLEAFEDDLKEKIKDIPEENLQVPPVKIAGPVLEALRYAYDEEELREEIRFYDYVEIQPLEDAMYLVDRGKYDSIESKSSSGPSLLCGCG